MTNDQAKFILSAYRPGKADADNPAFADAIRAAQADPALASWFEGSQALDRAVASKLSEIQPPAGLRGAILAGARVSRTGKSGQGPWAWVAAIAAAAALIVGVVSYRRTPASLGGAGTYASFVINDLDNGHHGSTGKPASELVAQLQVEGSPMPRADQIDFKSLKETGCRTLSFAGHDLVEVCFSRDGAMFHLYMMPRGAASALADAPVFVTQAGGVAAVWSDGKFDYALASKAGVAALRRLL